MSDNSDSISATSRTMAEPPAWLPFARVALMRLRDHHRNLTRLKKDAADGERPAFDALVDYEAGDGRPQRIAALPGGRRTSTAPDLLPTSPQARHLPAQDWDRIVQDGGDPFATDKNGNNRPDVDLPLGDLLFALRLVATFGSEAQLADCLAADAVTLLTGNTSERRLCNLLSDALLPPGWTVSNVLPQIGRTETLMMLDRVPKSEELSRFLSIRAPLLIAIESDEDRTDVLADIRIGIETFALAPLDQDILITLLCATHSATGQIDLAAVKNILPTNEALAALDTAAVLLALRAPTARCVAARLAECAGSQVQVKETQDASPSITLIGTSPAHDAARRLMLDLCLWRDGRAEWSELSRSLLIHGAPGTGKSYLARKMAESAGVALIQTSFAIWQSQGHLGHMLRAMRESFDKAIASAPSVLFIDEIDAIGSRFSRDEHGRNYHVQVVNGFLEQIDRLSRNAGVILLGACNSAARIDPAMLRPGRIDTIVEMPLPNRLDIEAMLTASLAEALPTGDITDLALEAVGRTPAEIDAALRVAKSEARQMDEAITASLIRKHLGASTTDPQYLYRVAVHEAGHAIAAHLIDGGGPTRIVVAMSGGITERATSFGHGTVEEVEWQVVVHMAGRAAERMLLKNVSAGAGGDHRSDLAQASRLILRLDRELGLGINGSLWLGPAKFDRLTQHEQDRVRVKLNEAEDRARQILEPHREALERLAAQLVEKRELKGVELEAALSDVGPLGPREP